MVYAKISNIGYCPLACLCSSAETCMLVLHLPFERDLKIKITVSAHCWMERKLLMLTDAVHSNKSVLLLMYFAIFHLIVLFLG